MCRGEVTKSAAKEVLNLLPGSWKGPPRPRTMRVEADWVTCTQ